MERNDRAPLATFFVEGTFSAGHTVSLSEGAAHHARVRRLVTGDRIRLTNGAGLRATAELIGARRNELDARVVDVESVSPTRPIHLLAPIGDRDRMLWLAEKATELGIASWQSVRFRRSSSVSPRGEGSAFAAKLRARMIAALEQSGGAWLPELLPDTELAHVDVPTGAIGLLLDPCGSPMLDELAGSPTDLAIVLGPEGGIEPEEAQLLEARGWRSVRLAPTTLRFETAAVAAIAVARATTLTEST